MGIEGLFSIREMAAQKKNICALMNEIAQACYQIASRERYRGTVKATGLLLAMKRNIACWRYSENMCRYLHFRLERRSVAW